MDQIEIGVNDKDQIHSLPKNYNLMEILVENKGGMKMFVMRRVKLKQCEVWIKDDNGVGRV